MRTFMGTRQLQDISLESSTIHSITKAFKDERGKKREKRGRPLILGEDLDKKLQQYLFKVSKIS